MELELENVVVQVTPTECYQPVTACKVTSGHVQGSTKSISDHFPSSIELKPSLLRTLQTFSSLENAVPASEHVAEVSTAVVVSLVTRGADNEKEQGMKKRRNLPGTPDPDAEVVALSPTTLMATHKFTCEVCGRGFQRQQNLQLHLRGHNLPGNLKPRSSKDKEVRKKVYVCPEPTCVHHNPSRALGDLTGIKKHFCRKHGEKRWECEKCCKKYAVLSDWKAHFKTCGTRDYRCKCGSLFFRRDSFVSHKGFCDELGDQSVRIAAESGDAPATVLMSDIGLFAEEEEPVSYRQLLGEDGSEESEQAAVAM